MLGSPLLLSGYMAIRLNSSFIRQIASSTIGTAQKPFEFFCSVNTGAIILLKTIIRKHRLHDWIMYSNQAERSAISVWISGTLGV